MQTIQSLFEGAGTLHGHYCGGLAIGVRAAYEAEELLRSPELKVEVSKSACWVDGIRWVLGAEKENGRLVITEGDDTVFTFYRGEDAVELRLRPMPQMEKEDGIRYILSAPRDTLFEVDFP